MKKITLGNTGITICQNGFGALPIQRVDMNVAIGILRKAYEGGIHFFDTARAYSDSEEKIGKALAEFRDKLYLSTKTQSRNVEGIFHDIDESLEKLKTDYIDIYQFHWAQQCYKPNDGTGMYEAMIQLKKEGKIRHIGITCHKIDIAEEAIASGLYETVQYPFNYLSTDREIQMVKSVEKNNMGFIAMKGLSGGLLTNSDACSAFMSQFNNLIPIWGIQKESELNQWLKFVNNPLNMNEEIRKIIERDKKELAGEFCRGCGYCAPCTVGINISNCARMSLLLRRSPSEKWLSSQWQQEMEKIQQCIECGVCKSRCPYQLDIPNLLKKNLKDYTKVLNGEIVVK